LRCYSTLFKVAFTLPPQITSLPFSLKLLNLEFKLLYVIKTFIRQQLEESCKQDLGGENSGIMLNLAGISVITEGSTPIFLENC